jgi:hypothetical protein
MFFNPRPVRQIHLVGVLKRADNVITSLLLELLGFWFIHHRQNLLETSLLLVHKKCNILQFQLTVLS